MAESGYGKQLGAAVLAPLAELAGYLALITRTNPRGSADALLGRPDVAAALAAAMGEGRESAMTWIEQGWLEAGAAENLPAYARLQGDISRIFGDPGHLRGLIRHAHASVPRDPFTPGAHAPGDTPDSAAAAARAEAVRDAVTRWGRQASQRARMALSAAQGYGQTAAALEAAQLFLEGGERVMKRWARNPLSDSCTWCRRLDGVTLGLKESFAPYLGGPVVLHSASARRVATPAGSARYKLPVGAPIIYTHPPRLYHGDLQGPLLHPFCECKLEIVRAPGGQAVPSEQAAGRGHPAPPGGFLAASDVRAMPEDQYQADLAFLRAAAQELGQVMRRLAEGR